MLHSISLCLTSFIKRFIFWICLAGYLYRLAGRSLYLKDAAAVCIAKRWLLQGKYFLVKDIHEDDDHLKTISTYLAPNCRQAGDGFPVYGMGQPTKDGLDNFMEGLKDGEADQVSLSTQDGHSLHCQGAAVKSHSIISKAKS